MDGKFSRMASSVNPTDRKFNPELTTTLQAGIYPTITALDAHPRQQPFPRIDLTDDATHPPKHPVRRFFVDDLSGDHPSH